MDRRIVRCSLSGLVLLAAAASPSSSQSTQRSAGATTAAAAATTSTSPPAVAESEPAPQPPRCRFEDLFRVELRDRKLAIELVPPKTLDEEIRTGEGAAITVIDSDAIDWRISVDSDDGGRDSGGGGAVVAAAAGRKRAVGLNSGGVYTRFTVAPTPDHMPDRWSPLQLTSVTSEDELSIEGSGRVGRTYVSVQYHQGRELNAARLTVLRPRRGGAGRPLHSFAGTDLLELWNNHQRECRMYLVPLLKTIAPGENLLRPCAGDVYRVFDDVPAEAQMIKRVAAMLPELEAESPAARDAASAKIEALGPAGVLAILRMDRAEWTPEQTARLATIVQRQSTLAEPLKWRRDIYFLTDCLDDGDPAVRRSALRSIHAIAGREVEFDIDATPEARATAAREILRMLELSVAGR